MKPLNSTFIETLDFNEKGLIPAIAQDWLDGAILMMAWMNRESIEKTISTGEVHYWSRSRKELWHKGETSGNTQQLKEIRYDCDADVLLLIIEQTGVACHTGVRSCFFSGVGDSHEQPLLEVSPHLDTCSELFQVIEHRRCMPEQGSYTNKLLAEGDNLILKKIGEESTELVMAFKDDEKDSIANEAADLIFHVQVALSKHKVNWRDVLKVLEKRRGGPRRS